MPWWSWLVIWTVLVLGLLGMLAFFAWWLFRKLMSAAREASALLDKTEILTRRAEELRDEPFHPAVLADATELRDRRTQALADRAIARQARRDARVRRGKLLVNADPFRFAHLIKRT
jgi:flagellar biosynthesis/type III secretory pathway M-ring protein FliF/YscJ